MQSYFGTATAVLALTLLFIFGYVLFGRLTARDRAALVEQHQTIRVDGRTRKYRFYSPNRDKKLPLVIMLHSFNYDSGRISDLYTGWSNLAKQTGEFAIVFPEGVGRSWNGGFCCGYAYARGINDVKFIDELITKLEKEHQIDSSKRYVAGFSNGSFLAQKLLADKPELFTAGAAVMTGVGEKDGEKLDISGATAPLIIVTGSEDAYTNHELNRVGFMFTSAPDTISTWSRQLDVRQTSSTQNDQFTQTNYKTDDGQTKLIYRLYKESHRWPQWRLWMFKDAVSPFTEDLWEQLKLLAQES